MQCNVVLIFYEKFCCKRGSENWGICTYITTYDLKFISSHPFPLKKKKFSPPAIRRLLVLLMHHFCLHCPTFADIPSFSLTFFLNFPFFLFLPHFPQFLFLFFTPLPPWLRSTPKRDEFSNTYIPSTLPRGYGALTLHPPMFRPLVTVTQTLRPQKVMTQKRYIQVTLR